VSTSVLFAPSATTEDRLESLGLSSDILTETILVGEAARASCTANDPPILPGLLAWGRSLRALAERLADKGWTRRDAGNFSTVTDPRLNIAIAVATGDEATGLRGAIPRTKYPKGPNTVRVVDQNIQQLRLFEEPEDAAADGPAALTWILLIARVGNQVRAELSLPDSIGADGRVEGWRERIILDPVRVYGDAGSTPAATATLETTEEIDIPITPKQER
jgi:hypothetical protein